MKNWEKYAHVIAEQAVDNLEDFLITPRAFGEEPSVDPHICLELPCETCPAHGICGNDLKFVEWLKSEADESD